ncbi:MAG: isochorismatase family cysteine hydrolase [Pseudomonadota bacterium]
MAIKCLIIIDMLNDYLDPWEETERKRLINNTNALIRYMREKRVPIVWVGNAFREDLSDAFLEMRDKQISIAIAGTRGAQTHPDLDARPYDLKLFKKRYSAFFGTGLSQLIGGFPDGAVVLAGVNTHACIRTAAIDAYQRDLRVVLASDCIGSWDEHHAQVSLDYMRDKIARICTNDEIFHGLGPWPGE